MTYRDRFENLLKNPRMLSAGIDLEFATSLFDSYKSNGSLSRGRREWLVKLEEKYKEEGWIDPLTGEFGTILKVVLANESLTDGDLTFANSLKNQYVRYKNLSEKQQSALVGMFDRYSPEGQKKASEWKDDYNKNHKQEAKIAAHYYLSNPPYFGTVSQRIIDEEGFIPSLRQFNKLTKNKYASRVIESTLAEPKFKVDDVVELRANAPFHSSSMRNDNKGFIIEVDSKPVTSAARSSKNYLVLPVGSVETVHIEERFMKRVKKI
jgi:hypothetical protein